MFLQACRYALSDGIPRRSFFVAIVVGTILNLINQGDALFGPDPNQLDQDRADLLGSLCGQHVWGGVVPPIEIAVMTGEI